MNKFDIENITYGDTEAYSKIKYHNILHNNIVIGVLIETKTETSNFKIIKQNFQFGEYEKFIPEGIEYFESKEGKDDWVFVSSDSLEDFIEKKNLVENKKIKGDKTMNDTEFDNFNEMYNNQSGKPFSTLLSIPECPVCGKEMSKTSTGNYICSYCRDSGWYDMPEGAGYYWRQFMNETPELCVIVEKISCYLVIFPVRETFAYLERNDSIYYQKVKPYDLPV